VKSLIGKVFTGWLLAATVAVAAPTSGESPQISWQGWSDSVFATATAQKRLVLLDLGAVWCHWCHVMEETTYRDPKVIALIRKHYVAVRVDQDSRPDLSNRYEDYGWPATVIFDASGRELVKFAGYIAPERMRSLLEAVVADPTPGPSAGAEAAMPSSGAALSAESRAKLSALLLERYDQKLGGWGFSKKYLDFDSVEYCLVRARGGDADAERMAKETLALSRKLIDPTWGGLYQYSDSGDWDHPHFEKLLQFQAEGIRVYAQAYALWRNPADLQAARDIHRYVRAFLKSPEGGYYVSQDADLVAGEHSGSYYALDDAGRRRRGIPRVDTHLYARESAWMANALVMLYAVTGEAQILEEASAAAGWVLAHRALPGGGFRHDTTDAAGPYLGDTVACGRAFLALWAATGDRAWLARSREAAGFIAKTFVVEGTPGLVSAVPMSRFAPPRPQRDENVMAARLANLLFRYTGDESDRKLADRAMAYLAVPEIAERFPTASVLLADLELSFEPPHVTVVGPRQDPMARTLLAVGWADLAAYRRVELWDRKEGALPNLDVEFPDLDRTAAFVCAAGRCSLPAFTAEDLRKRIARLRTSAVTP
jgi:uncharacterized protein YyaL (SSP411 family)